jgi:3-phenylpropionate/cinnamic acid dioxygenase small subunit
MSSELDPRVQELLDKQEIQEVVYRFARGVDRHDWDLVRSCYHDGALDNHGPFKGPVEEYVPWVADALPQLAEMTMHFIGNVLVEVDGDSAQSEAYVIGYHRYRRDDGSRWDWLGGGRYVDHFERRDGAWRIAERVLAWEWVRDDPVEQEWEGFGITGHEDYVWGRHDETDAIRWVGRGARRT